MKWYIDIATGGGALQVTSNVNNCLLLTSETKFGVTIPIAQLTQDVIAYANAGYQSVKSIGKTLTAGAVFGASGIIGRNSKKMLEGVAETGIGIMRTVGAVRFFRLMVQEWKWEILGINGISSLKSLSNRTVM